MDSETVENFIINAGRADFTKIASLVLTQVFELRAINVDGKDDGGVDWRVFKDAGGTTTVAFQDTVQKKYAEEKAFNDAIKAVQKTGATRYFFLTTRRVSATALQKLESKITTHLKIPATCLGATEIAQFIVSEGLTANFLDAIDAPLAKGMATRPDASQILLHAFSNFSDEKFAHQNQVYDEAVLLTAKMEGVLSRDSLAAKTVHFLNCPEARLGTLLKRIEYLLSKRQLKMREDKMIELDAGVAIELEAADRLYLKEFSSLQSAQKALMDQRGHSNWNVDRSERTAVYISRAFVKTQLDTIRSAGATTSAPGLVKNLGDPVQDLRDYLKNEGIPVKEIGGLVDELLEQAKDLPIIKKLTRAAVYVSLEGVDPISSAKAIGAARWSDVKIMLDASVAIPYLCCKLYRPIATSFFTISAHSIEQLRKFGCSVVIPWNYINEAASHLLRGLDYANLDDFSNELRHSENAYVANYYGLRSSGAPVPDSIRKYLETFSPVVGRTASSRENWIRNVMPDIQRLLGDYGIEYEDIPKLPEELRKTYEVEYTYRLKQAQSHKSEILVEHDVVALTHMRRQVTEKKEHWILLTWDKAMIDVGRANLENGWVISPEIALDFAQPYKRLSDTDLCALSHRIARTREGKDALSAAIIDKVVKAAREELQDWQFRQKVRAFKDSIVSRVDFNKSDYNDWVDRETDKFLTGLGISKSQDGSDVTGA